MKVQGIQSTKDYGIFKNIKGNRTLVPSHLATLTVSILENNMLSVNPIIVNEDMQIIDGQHRLEIAKNNKLEIYYLVLPGGKIENVIRLNANNRVWGLKDYLNSYAVLGHKSYQWVLQFMETHRLSPSVALYLIFASKPGGYVLGSVKQGSLSVTEEQKKKAVERVEIFEEVRRFVNRSNAIPRSILNAICILYKEGLGDKLIKSIQENGSMFTPKTDNAQAEAQLRRFLS